MEGGTRILRRPGSAEQPHQPSHEGAGREILAGNLHQPRRPLQVARVPREGNDSRVRDQTPELRGKAAIVTATLMASSRSSSGPCPNRGEAPSGGFVPPMPPPHSPSGLEPAATSYTMATLRPDSEISSSTLTRC